MKTTQIDNEKRMDFYLKTIILGLVIMLISAIGILVVNPPQKTSEPIQTPFEKVVIISRYNRTYKVKRIDKGVVEMIQINSIGNRNYVVGDTIFYSFR